MFVRLVFDDNIVLVILSRFALVKFVQPVRVKIDNVNNPKVIEVFDNFKTLLKTYKMDENMSGYEYQFIEANKAISNNLLEPSMHTNNDILKTLSILDDIRNQIGVIY